MPAIITTDTGNGQSEFDPCASLEYRMAEICRGTSGLSEEKRQAYLRRWRRRGLIPAAVDGSGIVVEAAERNPYGPTDRDRPCVHRLDPLREQTCDTCGSRGVVKTIFRCGLTGGECFEGLGGFRAPSKIVSCRHCDHYAPVEEAS